MTQQYRLEELLKLCSSLGIFFKSVVRRWQHWLTTASCVCVPWAADLSHLRDAKLTLWYCRCSADVASPPCASWRMMKEPVCPNQPSPVMVCVCVCVCAHGSIDYQLLRWQTGRRCGNMCWESQKPFILSRWGSGRMGSHTLIGD